MTMRIARHRSCETQTKMADIFKNDFRLARILKFLHQIAFFNSSFLI